MNPPALLPPVMELRQYTLHPGRRGELITLFEREFVDPQLACGMQLPGLFRDEDDPDRFVWLRGFAGMPQRAQALADFYGGPVWRAHREAANATMVDSDDVLLLRPLPAGPPDPPVPPGEGGGRVVATICPLRAPADAGLHLALAAQVLPGLRAGGAQLLGCFETEPAPNNFPRLPVREGEPVLVWFVSLAAGRPGPTLDAGAELDRWLLAAPRTLRLAPTTRSAWR